EGGEGGAGRGAVRGGGKGGGGELDVPIHTHAGGNLIEFQRIMEEYRKTPVQFLADIGFLDERTLLGHAVFTTAHPWPKYPFGDDLKTLAQTGATIGHCPYKYAKMAMTLHSLPRYLEAGVTVAIGTDTYPMDMVSELRWASILAKITDANYQVGLARDVFNAATIGGTRPHPREGRRPGAPTAPPLAAAVAGGGARPAPATTGRGGGAAGGAPAPAGGGGGGGRGGGPPRRRAEEGGGPSGAGAPPRHYWEQVPRWRW